MATTINPDKLENGADLLHELNTAVARKQAVTFTDRETTFAACEVPSVAEMVALALNLNARAKAKSLRNAAQAAKLAGEGWGGGRLVQRGGDGLRSLTVAQEAELLKLRAEDPKQWTGARLAARFKVHHTTIFRYLRKHDHQLQRRKPPE